MGAPYRLTPEGFESQQAVNYLSTTVLVDQLKSLLKPGQGRIIFVASAIHRLNYCNINDFDFRFVYEKADRYCLLIHNWQTICRRKPTRNPYTNWIDFFFSEGYCPYLAYAQSKLALITYACSTGPSLLEHHGLTLNSVHPGIVNTDLYRNKLVRLLAYLVFSVGFSRLFYTSKLYSWTRLKVVILFSAESYERRRVRSVSVAVDDLWRSNRSIHGRLRDCSA